jgi:hypothetical protein
VYVVVAVAVAVEHQRHETAANYERENDAKDHGHVAMDTHLHVNGIPGVDRPPESYAQNGEKRGRSSSWNKAEVEQV